MLPDPATFLTKLFSQLEPQPGALDHLPIDHICYRVAGRARYRELKNWLLAENELLVESLVNGRPIATYRMNQPFRFGDRKIPLLELPMPKPGSPYPEGWEHAEFVTDRTLADFEHWLISDLGIYPDDIDRSGLGKELNADLRLRLEGGISVKFHEQSLADVIRIEGNLM